MSAERVIAFNSIFAALGIDPHTAPKDVKQLVHDAALRYAKESGFRPAGNIEESKPTQSSRSNSGGFVFRFGKSKDKTPSQVDVDDLRFYERVFRESIDNPDKQQWRQSNERSLEAVRAELRRRGQAANHE